jgi:triphosphoribosyl-dephospho-CoA synthase
VHPRASFNDAHWQDFVLSAMVVSPILAQAQQRGVGAAVLASVQATQQVTQGNPNLGMLLLLAPLAAADRPQRVSQVLDQLTLTDARNVYRAIALASPGGLGRAKRGDVMQSDVLPLTEAMGLAADRDAVARQYVTGYADVFQLAQVLDDALKQLPMDQAIVYAHLHQMALEPDTLIARKRGLSIAKESQRRAKKVVEARWPESASSQRMFQGLDRWLGNQRNPGTSADLVAAALWVVLKQRRATGPYAWRENLW